MIAVLSSFNPAGGISVLDLKTGKETSELKGRVNTIASGGVVNDKLYLPIDGTTACTLTDDGKLESVWNSSRAKTSSASVVVQGNMIYALDGQGLLSRFNIDNGELVDKTRDVSGRYWATPAVAGKHMYFFTQDGIARVVDLETMKVVHKHEFENQAFLGSPAISGDAMYVRSHGFLFKIADTDGSAT